MLSIFDENHEEALATAGVKVSPKYKQPELKTIFKHQFRLTLIQYMIAAFLCITGVCLYVFGNHLSINIGSISFDNITFQNISLDIGAILILCSIYMGIKITLGLNIDSE